MLRAREAVLRLKEYHPPLGGRSGLRLDFNENTAGCSPRVLAKLHALDPEALAKYPEREPVERAVADHLGLTPEQTLLTNGVDEAIHLLCEAYIEPDDEVLVPVPTFSMYEIYAAAAGAKVISVPAGSDFRFPAQALLQQLTPRTRIIAVANPNNPTGAVADQAMLVKLAATTPQAALLVDEAYFDFYGHSLIPCIKEIPNLFVARTFSKAYGMAGLRAGVLVGRAEQMRMVRRVASPYNVNAAALACLPVALSDRHYVDDYVVQVRRGREQLERELRGLGIKYWPSQANFVLLLVGEKREAFVQAMRTRGILVRDRHGDPGCAGCVRITVGTDEQTETAIGALHQVVEEIGLCNSGEPVDFARSGDGR
jgi:histidinol-phosphate aminotransferase